MRTLNRTGAKYRNNSRRYSHWIYKTPRPLDLKWKSRWQPWSKGPPKVLLNFWRHRRLQQGSRMMISILEWPPWMGWGTFPTAKECLPNAIKIRTSHSKRSIYTTVITIVSLFLFRPCILPRKSNTLKAFLFKMPGSQPPSQVCPTLSNVLRSLGDSL